MKRSVPFTVYYRILFGGFLNQFGWIFFGFGMIFVVIFVGNADLSFAVPKGELIEYQGLVTGWEKTSFSEGDEDYSEPIFATHFSFENKSGKTFQATSYATDEYFKEGNIVPVLVSDLSLVKPVIKGFRRAPMKPFVLFVIIFPAIGGVFIFFGLKKGLKGATLLEEGVLAHGKLVDKKTTSTTVNNQMVYEFIFSFQDKLGSSYQVSAKTHEVGIFDDEELEPLLYLEESPEKAILLDDLPGQPRITENDQVISFPLSKTIKVLIIPFLSIVGNGAIVVIW